MNELKYFFEGRKLLIATQHQKEKVIRPLLEKELKVRCDTVANLNTDVFGTFTGETERKEDPLTTLRNKCSWAMREANYDLAVASEGSFGMHPSLFFVPADDELIILMDGKHKIEIIAREISTETNFNGSNIDSEEELKKFSEKIMFPSHALIVRASPQDKTNIIKGITDWDTLLRHYTHYKQNFGQVFVETDMRAMYNPMRMQVIEKATENLIRKIKHVCPKCATPGFDITKINKGLPCDWCNAPTNSVLSYVYECKKCHYLKEVFYPHQKTKADPSTCNICNP